MQEIHLFGLIKIGGKEHMRQLYEEGIIYMRHLSTFSDIEDNFRGDIYEKLSAIFEIEDFKILGNHKDGEEEEILYEKNAKAYFSYYYPDELAGNIFSMVGLFTTGESELKILDKRCQQFGDTCVIITNPSEFLSRIDKEALNQNFDLSWDITEYYDIKEYTGAWSPFKKPAHLSYQQEFRLLVKRKETDPVILRIGSINDIAKMINSADLNKISIIKSD